MQASKQHLSFDDNTKAEHMLTEIIQELFSSIYQRDLQTNNGSTIV